MFIALSLLGGLMFLALGANALVRGGATLAQRMGIPPLLVGLTVVAFGTSTPELFSVLQATHQQAPTVALGNIMGSNIFNIWAIMGVALLLKPMALPGYLTRRDAPAMLLATAALTGGLYWAHHTGQSLPRWAGGLALLALAAYTTLAYKQETKHPPAAHIPPRTNRRLPWLIDAGILIAGLLGLFLGAHLLVEGAVQLIKIYGWSESLIGLTLVTLGTASPELITTIVAIVQKQPHIAGGNLVGSNIFNILGILGLSTSLHTLPAPASLTSITMWVLLASAATFTLCAIMAAKGKLGRTEGALFLTGYVLFLAQLFYFH